MMKPKRFLESLIKPFFSSRSSRDGRDEEEELQVIAVKEQKVFRYETLAAATSNFDVQHKLGEGGFGPVFKGRLRDGREVAVKQLGRGSRQGVREFANEATLLSRVQHKNVVNLYGFCTHEDDKLLVYEFVTNQSLDKLLFAQNDNYLKRSLLDWGRRYEVMVGVARGLLYLHEDAHIPIIHRDIKASNILLDDRWVPKIADFGMARLYPEDKTVNTRIAGTNGYMAPEYAMHGFLSPKADVFSFGVLILELISGQKSSGYTLLPDPDAKSLLEWAWKLYREGSSIELLDPAIKSSADLEQAAMCVKIGLLCTQAEPKLRPNMKRVVLILSKKPTVLEEPTKPGMLGSRHLSNKGGRQNSRYSSGQTSSSGNSASTAASTATNTVTTSTTTTMRSARAPSKEKIISQSAYYSATEVAATSSDTTSRSRKPPANEERRLSKSRMSY